ncbi:MAG: DUF3037 domain-containing protein [Pelobium sp.]
MMQEMHLYEYAVIRVVPRVEREEFLNVGVVLYCAKEKFLQLKFDVNLDRLKVFGKSVDLEELKIHLHIFDAICKGEKCGSPIADLDIPSRFRWLTATRSTVLQTSKVHPGFSTDALQTINSLYENMVLNIEA